jgi:FkbM family methyltransferase
MAGIAIRDVERLADRLLPDGRLKELLRRSYRRRRSPFYALDQLVARAEPQGADEILVELRDGTRLHGPADRVRRRVFEYADHGRLPRLGAYGRWSIFLQILAEEFVEDVYGVRTALRPGDVVFDLGAHVGAFTVPAARAVGADGRVVALEPGRENHRLLARNVAANRLPNVTLLEEGAWSHPDRLKLRLSTTSGAHAIDSLAAEGTGGGVEEIVVDTVDNLVGRLALPRVDFVKMDVEGAEIAVLEGMVETLHRDRPALAIAAYHRVGGRETHRVIVPWLRRLGYAPRLRDGIVHAAAAAD